ncbi:MAG TPA: divalent heavy-metal cations transporter, partial [Patescibacteria group bacterium]|nr:divalent heavy-metal cations transporter [Patescibacteria group bacterium]
MLPILLSLSTFGSTLCGGIFALRHKDRLHRILGYTAGVILGVIAFDILPEIFRALQEQHLSA